MKKRWNGADRAASYGNRDDLENARRTAGPAAEREQKRQVDLGRHPLRGVIPSRAARPLRGLGQCSASRAMPKARRGGLLDELRRHAHAPEVIVTG